MSPVKMLNTHQADVLDRIQRATERTGWYTPYDGNERRTCDWLVRNADGRVERFQHRYRWLEVGQQPMAQVGKDVRAFVTNETIEKLDRTAQNIQATQGGPLMSRGAVAATILNNWARS